MAFVGLFDPLSSANSITPSLGRYTRVRPASNAQPPRPQPRAQQTVEEHDRSELCSPSVQLDQKQTNLWPNAIEEVDVVATGNCREVQAIARSVPSIPPHPRPFPDSSEGALDTSGGSQTHPDNRRQLRSKLRASPVSPLPPRRHVCARLLPLHPVMNSEHEVPRYHAPLPRT